MLPDLARPGLPCRLHMNPKQHRRMDKWLFHASNKLILKPGNESMRFLIQERLDKAMLLQMELVAKSGWLD